MVLTCPKCGSHDIEELAYRGITCIVCTSCEYDERDEIDVTPDQKRSQKAKAQHSPYRTGGGKRT